MIRVILTGAAAFLDKDTKASIKRVLALVENVTTENAADYDAQADAFLTALAQKDYPALAEICATWGLNEESFGGLPAYLITRIAEPIDDPRTLLTDEDIRIIQDWTSQ